MKPSRDPPRLLDPGSDAPEWLRSSLEAGAKDVPSPERLGRIAARLPVTFGGGPQNPPGAPRPPSPRGVPAAPAVPSALPGAVIGAAVGLALVGAGWLASSRAPAPPPSSPAPVVVVTAAAPAEPRLVSPPQVAAPSPRRRAPPASATIANPAPSVPVGSGPEPAASAGPEPSAVAERGPGAAEPDLQVAETESAILDRAQDALAGSPARALALTDLHLARYPGGQLAQEREVLAITALLQMGRASEARARAERFLAAYPTSGHRRRLAVLIPDLESHKETSDRPSTP